MSGDEDKTKTMQQCNGTRSSGAKISITLQEKSHSTLVGYSATTLIFLCSGFSYLSVKVQAGQYLHVVRLVTSMLSSGNPVRGRRQKTDQVSLEALDTAKKQRGENYRQKQYEGTISNSPTSDEWLL